MGELYQRRQNDNSENTLSTYFLRRRSVVKVWPRHEDLYLKDMNNRFDQIINQCDQIKIAKCL